MEKVFSLLSNIETKTEIPSGWSYEKLSKHGKCLTGLTYTPEEVCGNEIGLLVLRSSNIVNNRISLIDNVYVNKKLENRKLTKEGDILICVRNGSRNLIGKSAQITENSSNLAHGAFMSIFRTENYQFIFQLFQSESFFRQVYRNLGATINSINNSDLLQFKFLFPPISEQKKIAEILSTWDRAIEKLEKLIELKEQRKKGLMQQLLTGKKRLPGFGKPVEKTGEIPDDWVKKKFVKFLIEDRELGSKGDQAKKLTVKLYGKGIFEKKEKNIGSDSTQYYKRKSGQLIYSKLDFLNGAFGIVPMALDGYETTLDLPAFNIDNLQVDKKFFIKYIQRPSFYIKHLGLANGGRKARRVNPKDFLKISEYLPQKAEQEAIVELIQTFEKECEKTRFLLEILIEQKKGLMQKLLTGEIRVKD